MSAIPSPAELPPSQEDSRPEAGQQPIRYGWPMALGLLAAAFVLMVSIYWPGVTALVHIWLNSVTYAHGMIIVPLALWLVWLKRRQLAPLRPEPSLWGIAALAVLAGLWFAGRIVDVTSVQTFVVVALMPALALAFLGIEVARRLLFPLCFLFFAWPVGNFLVPILQDYTAWFAVFMLKAGGIPVYIEGHYISIPGGNFLVADACSGIRYLIASVAIGSVYAYLMFHSFWRRLAFMALAILLPVLANGVRAWGIITIAHRTDMEHAVGVDHLIYGWIFFGFVMALLFALGSLFREPVRSGPLAATPTPPLFTLRAVSAPLVLAAMMLGAGPAADAWLSAGGADIRPVHLLALAVDGWEGPTSNVETWQPSYAEPATVLHAGYHRGGAELGLHVLHYQQHGRGSEVIRYDNRIPDETVWRRVAEAGRQVVLSDGETAKVREVTMRSADGRSRIVWYWYQVGDTPTAEPVMVKLLEAWARLRGDERGSLLVTLTADYQLSAAEVREQLAQFLAVSGRRLVIVSGEGA